jgi:hypothetical protein
VLYPKDILENAKADEASDQHGCLNGLAICKKSTVIDADKDIVEFSVFKIAFIVSHVPR